MILRARMKHSVNLKKSFVIGDKESDVQLAANAGARGVLISAQTPESTSASHVAKDLRDAAEWILKQ